MNFLKKKLKPFTSGLTSVASNVTSNSNLNFKNVKAEKDLEDDLYDEYVVEAPPHPSELLALGVDPNEIDPNDPEKLKELYRKAKEEGKDKVTNSTLLARQRQKEEIEKKKKTAEEWKFFDSITARVEQVVKDSQKTLENLKESSAVDKLTQPDYELILSADEVFKSSATVKREKSADNWIDFGDESSPTKDIKANSSRENVTASPHNDEFACPVPSNTSTANNTTESQNFIVEEFLEDFGIDLRPPDQRKSPFKQKTENPESIAPAIKTGSEPFDLKKTARARPRPYSTKALDSTRELNEVQLDPFDTSFVNIEAAQSESKAKIELDTIPVSGPAAIFDPFDTSHVNL